MLNESQQQAVEVCNIPQLVIAGAGSGKTRVLTYKIAHLISKEGYKPWNILALTFTNKAANEMKQRIINLVGEDARYLNMGTFHSVFSRILRAEAELLGYTSQFTIYDETDSRSLLKSVIKDTTDDKGNALDEKAYKPADVHKRISQAKNNIVLPDQYKKDHAALAYDSEKHMPMIWKIYETYQERLQTSNAMDFDDLLLLTYLLFKNHEDVRQKYGERFKYVLVDEYQDTNAVQQRIVLQLVQEHHHICVVGDDAQSIYAFRGANIDNILDFQKKFEGTQLIKLEQNYRSTQTIVAAANSLISHNQRQIRKNVFSEKEQGERLQLKHAYSDREEAAIVCKDIRRLYRAEGGSWNDFAILYRTNAQSRTFEEQMRKDGIPYRIYGGLSFYQRKEIKDVIAYFRVIVNNHDEEALKRIINYPKRSIGATTVDKVMQRAHNLGIPAWDVLSQPEATLLDVNKPTQARLIKFTEEMQVYAEQADSVDAYTLGNNIIEQTGIAKDIFSGTDPDDISRQENLQELLASMQEFVESRREEGNDHVLLDDFLQEVSLLSDLDSDGEDKDAPRVTLMTIHAAKGLEFPSVFIVGMEENIFPSPMSCDSLRKLEEERRLLYVAITRAERHCTLTYAETRYRYGKMEFGNPSRFLSDIDRRYIQEHNGAATEEPSFSRGFSRGASGSSFSRRTSTPSSLSSPSSPRNPSSPSSPSSPRYPSSPSSPSSPSLSFPSSQPSASPTPRLRSLSQYQAAARHSAGSASPAVSVGDTIEHERFGRGIVTALEGSGENTKATVTFDNCGTKQLLLKFARFKKL